MQLMSILLLSLSVTMLVGAVLFVAWWHRTYRKVALVHTLREDIGHIGVSAIVAYPKTPAPLVALLEEEYPRSEAVIITDLEGANPRLGELVKRYHLVKVDHSHLEEVRALYRSRHRAFRRVVVVDLPMAHWRQASTIGREVASYDNILYLQGESIVEPNALTYCANVVALQRSADGFMMKSIVGADAHLERGCGEATANVLYLRSDCPLAWRRGSLLSSSLMISAPLVMVPIVLLSHSWILVVAAEIVVAIMVLFLYISFRAETKKSLLARLRTVFQNFYRFWGGNVVIRQGSKTHDTSPAPSRERGQSRPARYREDARP